MDHPFEVGKTYQNRKGQYEVLVINEPKMRVRYEDGREAVFTVEIQARILEGIQDAESAQTAVSKGRRKSGSTAAKRKKAGPTKVDIREKLIAEILENDEVIFEILTRLVIPPGQINTYRFFLKNPDDFISQKEFAEATRGSDQESLRGVLMAFGKRIGGSPDTRVRSLSPYNTLFFRRKSVGGKMHYRIRQRVAEIFATYPEFYEFLMNDNRPWLPDEFGSPHWTNDQAVHHAQLHYFGFWDRYQAEHS